jgi:hypothetical protein
MRFLLLALILCWNLPALAARCPVYSYLDQPSQDPIGLLKLDRNSEQALLRQIPDADAPSGKLCWYTRPSGELIARQLKRDKQYIFIRSDGHWTFSRVQELITISG